MPPNLRYPDGGESLAVKMLFAMQVHAGAIPLRIQRHETLEHPNNTPP
jgi:hypothetical protein